MNTSKTCSKRTYNPEKEWEMFCERARVPKTYQSCCPSQLIKSVQQAEIESITSSSLLPLRSAEMVLKAYEEWIKTPFSLLLMGDTGLGKTHFMYLIIKHLVMEKNYLDFRFFKMNDLDNKLLAQFNEYKTSEGLIRQCCETEYLFLDDLATERVTDRVAREFYEIIDYRVADERVTIISTNLNEGKIKEVYSAKTASRIKTFTPLVFVGEDRRRRKILK